MVLFENFKFYYDNNVLCNYVTIAELGIPNHSIIKVVIEDFNMKSV